MDTKPSGYELVGKVKLIEETRTFGSGFTKREFVVTTDERYPQDVKFEVVKDKCSLLDKLRENDQVKVSFNIRGNEYNGRYYVNLQAWRIEPAGPPLGSDEEPEEISGGGNLDDMEDSPF